MHVLRVLGAVDVADGSGGWRRAGSSQQSCVLAALATAPGARLSVADLIARVWGARPPPDADDVLYGHITRLRDTLAETGDAGVRLTTSSEDGYRLDIDAQHIDLFAMRALVARAQQSRDAEAVQLWRRACDTWRGQALLGVPGAWAKRTRRALHREHVTVMAQRFAVELALGNHTEVVDELYHAVSRAPTAEALVGQLMTALYRNDQASDAVASFDRAKKQLREKLGIDPAPRLRQLHRRILRHDPGLNFAPVAPADSVSAEAVPLMRLPPATSVFTGRGQAVAQVLSHARGGVAVTAVDGMAGVGKTALAVHVAHALTADFPDGRLYIDLHGFTAGTQPLPPTEALSQLLRAVGIPRSQIPDDVGERTAAFREALSRKRALVVLDNAVDARQVRPLLPGGDGPAYVLVTSRHRLSDLEDVAQVVSLDELDSDDAVALFNRIQGKDQDNDQVREVVELCGRLPLAIRIAASRLRSHPQWTMTELLERLSDAHRRLTELDIGQRGVPAALQTSYRELDAEHRRTFRMLSVAIGADFSAHCAALLLDIPLAEANQRLAVLVEAHLLRANTTGRYEFHDLLRLYASEACAATDDDNVRQAALTRLLGGYCHAVNRAGTLIATPTSPATKPARAPSPQPFGLELADNDAAVEWFDAEHRNLIEAMSVAAELNMNAQVWTIATGLSTYLNRVGSYGDIIAVAEAGAAAARIAGASSAQAILLKQLGGAHRMLNRFAEAAHAYQRSLTIMRGNADRRGQARSLNSLGLLRQRQGKLAESVAIYEKSLALIDAEDGLRAMVLTNLGVPLVQLRQPVLAMSHYRTAIQLYRGLSHESGVATATTNMGSALWQLGRFDEALHHHESARSYFQKSRVPHLLAVVDNALGCDLRCLGRFGESIDSHRRSWRTFKLLRDRHFEADALVEWGRSLLTVGDAAQALRLLREAAEITESIECGYHQARAHHGIADALMALGETGEVRAHVDEALRSFQACGAPEADDLKARLADGW